MNKKRQLNEPMSRRLRFLLFLPIAGGAVIAAWFWLALDFQRLAFFWLVFPVVAAFVRFILKRLNKNELAQRILDWLALASGLAGWLPLAFWSLIIAPWRASILLVLLIIVVVVQHRRDWTTPIDVLFLLIAFVLSLFRWHALALILPGLAVFILITAKRLPAWRPRSVRWSLLLLIGVITAIIIPYSFGSAWSKSRDIDSQPGVQAIYDAEDPSSPLHAILGDDLGIAVPDCFGRILVGTRSGASGLVRLDALGVAASSAQPIADFIACNCRQKQIYVVERESGLLHALDHNSLQDIDERLFVRIPHPAQMRFDPVTDKLYISRDSDERMVALDVLNFAHDLLDFRSYLVDFLPLPKHDLMVTATWGGWIDFYQLSDKKFLDRIWLPDFSFSLHPSYEGHRLWLAGRTTGALIEIRLPDKQIIRHGYFGAGLHHVVDQSGNTLALGNALTGEVLLLDRKTLEVKQRLSTGNDLHNLVYFPRRQSLVAAASSGLWELALPAEAE